MNEFNENVYRYDYPQHVRKEIEGLEKIASAIIYDGKVDLYEVQILREWIKRNADNLTEKPLSELKALFEEIDPDVIISPKARETLFHFLDAIASEPAHRGEIPDFFDEINSLNVKNKTFAFEGRLVFGSKYKAEQVIVSNGGNYAEFFNEKVDCLVVGVLPDEAYNRKEYPETLRSAIEARTANGKPLIIREREFVQHLIG